MGLTILFASQTGQAEAIAREIYAECANAEIVADICCLSLTEKKFCLNEEKLVIFVVSTTGDGEPPDTARKFFRRLNKKTIPNDYLKSLSFGLLALGDSNYTNFCNCGKALEKRLLNLGAKPFYPTGYADDAVGLEVVVEPWIEGLWSALKAHVGVLERDKDKDAEKTNKSDCKIYEDVQHSLSTLTVDSKAEDVLKQKQSVQFLSSGDITFRNRLANFQSSKLNSKEDTVIIDENIQNKKSNGNWVFPSRDLADKPLKLPNSCLTGSFTIDYHPELKLDLPNQLVEKSFPAAISKAKLASIVGRKQLTQEDAVKTTLELELDISGLELEYQPGDTFGIICPNDTDSVDYLLARLGIRDLADVVFTLNSNEDGPRKDKSVSTDIPLFCSLKYVFTNLIDIRAVPKKALLRLLSNYTEEASQKRRLQELSSVQGAKDYIKWIREPRTNLLDLLRQFPSCFPPVESLFESLPRLQPRAYSVASSPLTNKNRVIFVFNIAVIGGFNGVTPTRTGLCTGWLDRISSFKQLEDIDRQTQKLGDVVQIPLFWRHKTSFRMPADHRLPVIMIGPGTGVAPFIGFLKHRELQMQSNPKEEWGPMFLFYGCRQKKKDYLYREALEDLVSKRVLTELFVSFSRDEDQEKDAPRYVQDSLTLQQELVIQLILEQNAVVYVCGDAANMARSVRQAILKMLQHYQGIPEELAMSYFQRLTEDKRYLEDIWS